MRALKVWGILATAMSLSSCLFTVDYTVSGNISGLEGTGLVLENNGGNATGFTSDGSFRFSASVAKGATYLVTVSTQPSNPTQTCTVHNGSGSITDTDITNVIVTCTQAGRFAYVANQTDNTISAFAIDSTTGAFVPIEGSPFASTGTSPVAAVVDPNGEYLYVVNEGSNSVTTYSIDYATGVLTVGGDVIATGNGPSAITIDSTNRYMYVTNSTDDTLSAYTLSNGQATAIAGSPFAVGATPFSVKVDPSGNFLYVANYGGATVSGFLVDTTTGALTTMSGSPFGTGGDGPISIAIDPLDTFLYVANETGASIATFSLSETTGELAPLSGSPVSTATSPESLVVNPGGSFIYAANVTSKNDIANYAITPTTGALTLGTDAGAGTFPLSLAVDAGGGFLYGVNNTSDDVSVYSIDATTGTLSPVSGSPFAAGGGARAIAID